MYEIIELYPNDIRYPKMLNILKNPPKIYVLGNVEILNKDSIAVIGSRNSTEYGQKMAKKFTKELTNKGLVIVSGLAIGIDTIAHYECIKTGGKTIAVVGSGFDYIYPSENIGLFNLILETGGAIITEYAPSVKMKKSNFPARNRIVSALTWGTLVVEATYRSGTSITANYAVQQGKKVFCVPNCIGNKNSCGTINLLTKGAKIVKDIDSIISELPELKNKIEPIKNISEQVKELSEKEQIKTNSLQTRTIKGSFNEYIKNAQIDFSEDQFVIAKYIFENYLVTASQICEGTGICIKNVNIELTNLEILGIIKQEAGNKFSIL